MHHLSRIARHSRSATRLVPAANKNVKWENGSPLPSASARRPATSHDIARRTITRDSAECRRDSAECRRDSAECRSPLGQRNFVRMHSSYSSNFYIHPEKLMQIIKERDGQSLCSYYDSDIYKQKAIEVVEQQSRVIYEGTPLTSYVDLNDSDVTYEHMLSCAQPRQKPKVIVIKKKKEKEDEMIEHTKQKKVRRSIVPEMLRRKRETGRMEASLPEAQVVYSQSGSENMEAMNIRDNRRRYRKRTTIMPLYLKKIQENLSKKEVVVAKPNSPSTSAQRFDDTEEIDYENQLLNTRKMIHVPKARNDEVEIVEDPMESAKNRLVHLEYENKLLQLKKFRCHPKYSQGTEEERHWYHNPHLFRK